MGTTRASTASSILTISANRIFLQISLMLTSFPSTKDASGYCLTRITSSCGPMEAVWEAVRWILVMNQGLVSKCIAILFFPCKLVLTTDDACGKLAKAKPSHTSRWTMNTVVASECEMEHNTKSYRPSYPSHPPLQSTPVWSQQTNAVPTAFTQHYAHPLYDEPTSIYPASPTSVSNGMSSVFPMHTQSTYSVSQPDFTAPQYASKDSSEGPCFGASAVYSYWP
ncbi:hypothetical protein M422DRAFT_265577 [Sphaerobolus stellatus SS14]|uniref:Uncharacterized protein n=1 Tax=Sphaerobolus stellatus (strain SS14) TaxID=990650 RepID=A0A0C9V559_SPHS4|nr:hypothetical protein M422DRAFT_265577 [Sphaerobolus stellatus SS14]